MSDGDMLSFGSLWIEWMRIGPQHPAVKLRELTTRLAKEFNVRVAYYHDNLQLRFGERPLANDWLRLARRIARQVRACFVFVTARTLSIGMFSSV